MNQILLIEDSEEIQDLVSLTLGYGFKVTAASTFEKALELIKTKPFDLYLIDIELPDGNGYQICSTLQNDDALKKAPIIFLTAKTKPEDIVMGYKLGADDYITKPIEPNVFKAKIESKLNKLITSEVKNEWIKKGNVRVNPVNQKLALVKSDGSEIEVDLTPIEFRMVVAFIKNENIVLTRDQIIDKVWKDETYITDRVVDMHISSLRKKLETAGKYIRTIYGSGYCFTVDTKEAA